MAGCLHDKQPRLAREQGVDYANVICRLDPCRKYPRMIRTLNTLCGNFCVAFTPNLQASFHGTRWRLPRGNRGMSWRSICMNQGAWNLTFRTSGGDYPRISTATLGADTPIAGCREG